MEGRFLGLSSLSTKLNDSCFAKRMKMQMYVVSPSEPGPPATISISEITEQKLYNEKTNQVDSFK